MAREPRRKGVGAEYAVGFGKPPQGTRFQKGRSGNPAGRPRGALDFDTLLDKALAEKVVVKDASGRRRAISKLEAALIQVVNKAAGADQRATKIVLDLLAKRQAREGGAPDPLAADAGGAAELRPLPSIDWSGMTTSELIAVKEAIGIIGRRRPDLPAAAYPMPPVGPGEAEPYGSESILRYYKPSPGYPPDGGEGSG